jgi:hypothetical protein
MLSNMIRNNVLYLQIIMVRRDHTFPYLFNKAIIDNKYYMRKKTSYIQ